MKELGQACCIPTISVSYTSPSISRQVKVRSSDDACKILRSCFNEATIEWREEFWVIFLNRANGVLGSYQAGLGSCVGTVVHVKAIFAISCLINASGVILAHNHPSGNPKPSESDKLMTEKIGSAMKLVEADLLDHIIVTKHDYYSFADEGCLA